MSFELAVVQSMTVQRGRLAERRRQIAARLEVMLAELEGFEADLGIIIPSKFGMGRYYAAVRHMRALIARLQPGRLD